MNQNYIENNSDLKAIFGDNEEAATRHFIKNATFETGYGTIIAENCLPKKYSNKCDFELPISNNEDGIIHLPIIVNKREKPVLHLKNELVYL